MKTRSLTTSLLLAALAVLLSAASTEAAGPVRHLPPLEQFMEAGFILKTYGKPSEIRPMKQSDSRLKVEQWIYRRRARETAVPTASNQTTIPAYIGHTGTGGVMIVDVPIPEYRLKNIVIYQVTALLMVNDQLSHGTQWMEKDESYQ